MLFGLLWLLLAIAPAVQGLRKGELIGVLWTLGCGVVTSGSFMLFFFDVYTMDGPPPESSLGGKIALGVCLLSLLAPFAGVWDVNRRARKTEARRERHDENRRRRRRERVQQAGAATKSRRLAEHAPPEQA